MLKFKCPNRFLKLKAIMKDRGWKDGDCEEQNDIWQ